MSPGLLQKALDGIPIDDFPIVDFHVHIGHWGMMHLPVADDDMIPLMDRAGVNRICTFGILYPDVKVGNDNVAEFVTRHPDRVVGFTSLNPFQGNMEDELKRCAQEHGFRGIKLHEYVGLGNNRHPMANAREYGDWDKVFSAAANLKLPILFHGIVTENDMRNFPETVFVRAHGLCDIKGTATKQRLAEYPNLYVDTCHTQNTVWEAEETVSILGPDRVLWGTDAPLDDFAQRLGIILSLGISDGDKAKILGGNAIRLLGLD